VSFATPDIAPSAGLPHRDPDYFHQLMTRGDLEAIISTSDMCDPTVQLAKGGIHCAIDNPPTAG
jgi:hypothetical protein